MTEIEITSGRLNEMIDPVMHIWGYEVAAYLFLGGLSAGLMVLPAIRMLMRKEGQEPVKSALPLLLVSVFMSIGMFFLFLDLHYKIHVFRFYTTFQPASPMSWGAWILLLVYPLSLLLGLSRLFVDYPSLKGIVPFLETVSDWAKRQERWLIYGNIGVGIGLGVYTGILLSSYVARPAWNSSLLGVLFLTSGVSTGAAFLMLITKDHQERTVLSKLDSIFIAVELALLALFFIGLSTAGLKQKEAAHLFLGGAFTAPFWSLVVGMGLVVPLFLEIFELKGRRIPLAIPATLILAGGFLLRVILLKAGQLTTYLPY